MAAHNFGVMREATLQSMDSLKIDSDDRWDKLIPKETLDQLSKDEIKRQHHIFEIISNQRNYVDDLNTVYQFYYVPLLESDFIDPETRQNFISTVFGPFLILLEINKDFLDVLLTRQEQDSFIVQRIGDVFLGMSEKFQVYAEYGEQKEHSKACLEAELKRNSRMKEFIQRVVSSGSQMKDLESYLTNFMKRFTDYGLMLKDVFKRTPDDHVDKQDIVDALAIIKDVGTKMNNGVARAGTKLRIDSLKAELKPDYKVLPLDLCTAYKGPGTSSVVIGLTASSPKKLFTVECRGKQNTFLTATEVEVDIWVRAINDQKEKRAQKAPLSVLDIKQEIIMNDIPVISKDHVSATVVGSRLLIATESRIFAASEGSLGSETMKMKPILGMEYITAIDAIPELDQLYVLADRTLYTFPLQETLTSPSTSDPTKKAKKVAKNVSFFKIGYCVEKKLVCVVSPEGIQWNFKLLDPTKEKKSMLGKAKMLDFKEFVIPTKVTSVEFFKSQVILSCGKGFEVVDLQKIGKASNYPLLDQKDDRLSFILGKESLNPVTLFKTQDGELLLCFHDCGFYVDRKGRRTKESWIVDWEGSPTDFAYFAPYIISCGPRILTVYDSATGEVLQALHGQNLQVLHVFDGRIYLSKDGEGGQQQLFCVYIRQA
ncbi:RHO1 GDP-GTP exchange protein 2 [Chytridiales sp. JEL 0842]|nr:RHO1 GDP-GTP exchange protein 2 [Chytridiales sp. JEL 0842]